MDFFATLPKSPDKRALFAFDKHYDNGAKCYVRSNYIDFVNHLSMIPYQQAPQVQGMRSNLSNCFFSHQCAYELMRPNNPSKLFLDLEYSKECNKDLDEMTLLKGVLMDVVVPMLKKHHNVECTRILLYTASNEKKSSFHVIFPNVIFENYLSVFSFIKNRLVPKFRELHADVRKKDGTTTSFIDPLGGSFRAFRLPYQYKKTLVGKRPLLPMSPMTVNVKGSDAWKKQILDACVQYIPNSSDFLSETSVRRQCNRSASGDYDVFTLPILKWVDSIIHPKTLQRREVTGCTVNLDKMEVFLSSRDHYCEYKVGAHAHNCVYYVVDLEKRVLYQKCYPQAKCPRDKHRRIFYKIPDMVLETWDIFSAAGPLFSILDSI